VPPTLTIATVLLTLAIGPSAFRYAAAHESRVPAEACASPNTRVYDAGFIPIGGIEQWVTITGERCENPVLLFLHGGPGNPMSPYAATIFSGWERDFTLVQWDQRGAGRTFGRNPPGDTRLTVRRMTDDGLALAEYLRKRLGKRKVVLVAGSWGSILGVHMIKARIDRRVLPLIR
jgi:pimeloyl-ACP methyl ester carboxylesterase